MSERSALYLTIARRCAAEGQTGRAIVTIVNALKNNPQFLETQPEAIDFLAEILVPGFEEEIHRLEACYPSFGYKFYDALAAHGKTAFAHELEQSFGAYCIERMKTVQSRDDLAFVNRSVRNYINTVPAPPIPDPVPNYRQTAAESGFFKATPKNSGLFPPLQHQTPQNEKSFTPPPQQTPQNEALLTPPLPNDVWIPSIQENINSSGQMAYEKHEFASQNIDACSSEGLRRFDRIRTQHTTEVVAKDYADTAADRVILDFDNRVRETPKAAMFATANKTKFRSFAEDLAQWREESRTEPKRQILTPVQNPMEVVAETTHALVETPSVEPYTVRHPLRFRLTPQHIVTCVFICLIGIIGLITWHTAAPALEKRAIEDVSSTYLMAADSGQANPIETIDTTNQSFVNAQWMESYRLFLSTWQNIYYETQEPAIPSPDSEQFLHEFSAAHAAYITQEISLGRYERARLHFESVPASVWRDHPYFKTWSMAQLEIAAHDYRTAAIRFEKLLRTPLAPFALVQLGLLSLEEAPVRADIQQRFLNAIDQTEHPENIPVLAKCAHDIISRTNSLPTSAHEAAPLKSPYSLYCAIGHVFRNIDQKARIDRQELNILKQSAPLSHGESFRIEAIIEAELYDQHPDAAVQFYKTLELPDGHPQKTRLLNAILSKSLYFGNWKSLHSLNPNVPESISYLAAARIIDEAHESGKVMPDGKLTESMLKYQAPRPPAAIDTLMDEAYVEAESGNLTRALNITRSQLNAHPEYIEPLLLQAWILSQMGNAQDAADILEQNMATGQGSTPLLVLSNLYRARFGLPLNYSAIVLPHVRFNDNVLESARCEILWRRHDKSAAACLNALSQRPELQAKSTWIMMHLDDQGVPTVASAQWSKAGTGMLSFPGYHLAYGRKLISEGEFQKATRAYTRAIIHDFSTSNRATIDEFANLYSSRQRRYEGTKKFEELIEIAEKDHRYADILGPLHIAAAHLYQPENGHSTARQHLGRALDILGEQPEILRGMIQYYEAKDKPDQARIWRQKLIRSLNP
ncbi:MAG: hypothetical protein IJM59_11525 [Proteobacteria bacterium]|nr:hypothetical protein [Pseudomonadota bacterium]